MNIKTLKEVIPFIHKAKVVPFIWGHHGIGKSSAVRQYCEENELDFVDLRLGNMEVGDLIGLPDFTVDEQGNKVATKFMRPSWLPTSGKGVVFLDEINRARRDVLQATFQFVLDRKIHEYTLPEGWSVVVAANPNTNDYIVTDVSDEAFMARFAHIKLSPSMDEWTSYMRSQSAEASVASFFTEQSDLLNKTVEDFKLSMAKPNNRTADMLQRIIDAKLPDHYLQEVAAGCIGTEAAVAFLAFRKSNYTKIDVKDVLNSYSKIKDLVVKASAKETNRFDILNQVVTDLVSHFKEIAEKDLKELEKDVEYADKIKPVSKKQVDNLIAFLLDIPADMSVRFLYTDHIMVKCIALQKGVADNQQLIDLIKNNKAIVGQVRDAANKDNT